MASNSTERAGAVGLTWSGILSFLRISTNPRVLRRPLTADEAVAVVSDWLNAASVVILGPGDRHWEILAKLLVEGQVRGPLVTDAHLAALAIEHGALLCTTDRDFARFPGLRMLNPLKSRVE